MKNTWRILGAVAALTLGACTDDNGGGGGGSGGSCTGNFSGAVTATVRTCTVTAAKLANGQLLYTIEIEPATGGTLSSVDNVIISVLGDAKAATYSGADVKQATGTVISTDGEKEYKLQLGYAGEALGSATLTINAVPAGQPVGNTTQYAGFGGTAQVKYTAATGVGHTGDVNLSLTFKR
jgi:hypothetical protein